MGTKLEQARALETKAREAYEKVAEAERTPEIEASYAKAMTDVEKLVGEHDAEVKVAKEAEEAAAIKAAAAVVTQRRDAIKARLDSATEVVKPSEPVESPGVTQLSSGFKAMGYFDHLPAHAQSPDVIKASGSDVQAEWALGQEAVKAYLTSRDDLSFQSDSPEQFALVQGAKAVDGSVYVADAIIPAPTIDMPGDMLERFLDVRTGMAPAGNVTSLGSFSVSVVTDIDADPTKSTPTTAEKPYKLNRMRIYSTFNNEEISNPAFAGTVRDNALYAARLYIRNQVISGIIFTGSGTAATGKGVKGSYTNAAALPNYADTGVTKANLISQEALPSERGFEIFPGGLIWSMHRSTWGQVRSLYDGTTQAIETPDGRVLHGYPVVLNDQWDQVTSAGVAASRYSAFGNFKFYTFLQGIGVSMLRRPHIKSPDFGVEIYVYAMADGVFHDIATVAVAGGA